MKSSSCLTIATKSSCFCSWSWDTREQKGGKAQQMHIFAYMFTWHINQKLVEDRRLIMSNVCLFIFGMHWILIVVIRTCFNSKHRDLAFSMANMFTKTIQLWSHELFFLPHGCNSYINHDALNPCHQWHFQAWQVNNLTILELFCSLI